MYFCHLFLISSAYVCSWSFLSCITSILAWNIPLISPVYLKRSLVFPMLLFSSISWHYSFKKAFSSFLAILCNSALVIYISFFLLFFTFLLYSAICKTSSDNHLAFLHFFFFGIILVTASCAILWTSVHGSSGTVCIRSNPLNLFITSTTWC